MPLQTEFREDLKGLYKLAGGANKPTVFLFDETQIVMETFVEDVNNILTSGEVPNLFGKDEIGGVLDEVRADAKKVACSSDQILIYSGMNACMSMSVTSEKCTRLEAAGNEKSNAGHARSA